MIRRSKEEQIEISMHFVRTLHEVLLFPEITEVISTSVKAHISIVLL